MNVINFDKINDNLKIKNNTHLNKHDINMKRFMRSLNVPSNNKYNQSLEYPVERIKIISIWWRMFEFLTPGQIKIYNLLHRQEIQSPI